MSQPPTLMAQPDWDRVFCSSIEVAKNSTYFSLSLPILLAPSKSSSNSLRQASRVPTPRANRVESMAPKSYQGIPCARYISFSTILILNIKWPLADIFNLKNSTSSSENENTLLDLPKSVTNNTTFFCFCRRCNITPCRRRDKSMKPFLTLSYQVVASDSIALRYALRCLYY
jgi:hypothetical protein